jgi:hypothetical protein
MTLTPIIVLWAVFTWGGVKGDNGSDGNAWQPLQWYRTVEDCQAAKRDLDARTDAWIRGECRDLQETNR